MYPLKPNYHLPQNVLMYLNITLKDYTQALTAFLISFTRLSKVVDRIILRHDEMAKRVSNR